MRNIDETIGVGYEVIVIDNVRGKYSIFEAYNEGVRRACGDILCFLHEDVNILTDKWGETVCRILADDSIGLVGAVGGHVLPSSPSSWWTMHYDAGQYMGKTGEVVRYWARRERGQVLTDVVGIDGLWFCIPSSLFRFISFDECTFNGFHCYDSDICMQVIQAGRRVCVSYDILIRHLSDGSYGPEYRKAVSLFYDKWQKNLPIVRGIEVSDIDIGERMRLVLELQAADEEIMRLRGICRSKSYLIGAALLRPFKYVKNLLLRIYRRKTTSE